MSQNTRFVLIVQSKPSKDLV